MAEWLTHVFIAYALFTIVGWSVDWLDEKWVTVGMVGSILPDLNRLDLLIDDGLVMVLTGGSFDWSGLQTVGGAVVLSAIGAMLFGTAQHRKRAFVVLLSGAVSHILVDLPQRYADGRMLTNVYLFPFPPWRPPTPGWYVSADRWVVVIALAVALVIFIVDHYRADAQPVDGVDQ